MTLPFNYRLGHKMAIIFLKFIKLICVLGEGVPIFLTDMGLEDVIFGWHSDQMGFEDFSSPGVHPNKTAPTGAAWSGSTLFVKLAS